MTKRRAADSTNSTAIEPQTVQIVRQVETMPYWFLLIHYILIDMRVGYTCLNDISHCIFMGFGMEHFTLH
ncbi:transposase [Neisseria meningitidis]|nr:transposase [Neisseria meningitidis]